MLALLLGAVCLQLFFEVPQAQGVTPEELARITQEAYLYSYPSVLMEVTRKQMTNADSNYKPGYGPPNTFSHFRKYPSAGMREIVRPNFDTLYSWAWLDIKEEPVVISVPDSGGRFYLLQMLDMYSDAFAVPGKRTSGTEAANFAVVSPTFSGSLPANLIRIQAPTPMVWVLGRTQTNGPQDYATVHKFQDGLRITSLSDWPGIAPVPEVVPDPSVDMGTPPMLQVQNMSGQIFFELASRLLHEHRPHDSDGSQLLRFRRIGFVPNAKFDFSALDTDVQAALENAARTGIETMRQLQPKLARVSNGWGMNIDTMGVYGNSYAKRAIVAWVGVGANAPQDAIYPLALADADGQPLVGNENYILHFDKSELPPVDAFWSLTMYDEEGFPVANPIDRHSIHLPGDDLYFNEDGSLDLYIHHKSPGAEKEANWLPSPSKGRLGVTMRLYAPRVQVLTGEWNPPKIQKESIKRMLFQV